MPIDVEERYSDGWWLKRGFRRLNDKARRDRLHLVHEYYHGRPRLAIGAENAKEAFQAFQRQAGTNFAKKIVESRSHRMTPVGFHTGVDNDETGDAEAAAVWKRAGLDVKAAELHDLVLNMGEAYVVVGEVDPRTNAPVVTAEDPRFMVGIEDATNPIFLSAAVKSKWDDVDEVERAYLYLPGRVRVARRSGPAFGGPGLGFSPRNWSWDDERSGDLLHDQMPVVRFENKDGVGEVEEHIGHIDRINKQVLDRMTIATMQAFRQRGIKGLPLTYPAGHPKAGEEIDWSDAFTMHPAALWMLPEAAEVWESGTVDLTPILAAVKDDVSALADVTHTNFRMVMPDGANQTAEGASSLREDLKFTIEDRITRVSHPWTQVMSLLFLVLGDPRRTDLAALGTLWRPVERLSLTERADASSKAQDMPWRSKMIHIWGFTPVEVDRMASERADDQLFAAQIAAAMAGQAQPAQPEPATPAGVTEPSTVLPPIPTAAGDLAGVS